MAVKDITKLCKQCEIVKPIEAFSWRNKAKGKRSWNCKDCHKAYIKVHYKTYAPKARELSRQWRIANPEQKKANDKAWHEANKDRSLAHSLKWVRENPEKRKAAWTKYRVEKLDRARASESAYRERNRAVCNARIVVWKGKNKPLLAEYSRRRHAVRLKAVPVWADQSAMRAFYKEADKLRNETGQDWHVDHIVPLSGKIVCGLHCEANLQVLPGKENLKKNRHRWPDMP
jgi:hypothetical protein